MPRVEGNVCSPSRKVAATPTPADPQNSARGSCTPEPVFVPPTNTLDGQKCYLFVDEGDNQKLAAIGRAWLQNSALDTVHGEPIGDENVRVSIDVAIERKAIIPFPTDEAFYMEDIVGGFVRWPRRLVALMMAVSTSRGPISKPPSIDNLRFQVSFTTIVAYIYIYMCVCVSLYVRMTQYHVIMFF